MLHTSGGLVHRLGEGVVDLVLGEEEVPEVERGEAAVDVVRGGAQGEARLGVCERDDRVEYVGVREDVECGGRCGVATLVLAQAALHDAGEVRGRDVGGDHVVVGLLTTVSKYGKVTRLASSSVLCLLSLWIMCRRSDSHTECRALVNTVRGACTASIASARHRLLGSTAHA